MALSTADFMHDKSDFEQKLTRRVLLPVLWHAQSVTMTKKMFLCYMTYIKLDQKHG